MRISAPHQLWPFFALGILIASCGLSWGQSHNLVPDPSVITGVGSGVGRVAGAVDLIKSGAEYAGAKTPIGQAIAVGNGVGAVQDLSGIPGSACGKVLQGAMLNAQCGNGAGNALIQENLPKCGAVVGAAILCGAATSATGCGAVAAAIECAEAVEAGYSAMDLARMGYSAMTAAPPVPLQPKDYCATHTCIQTDNSGHRDGQPLFNNSNPWSYPGDDGTTPVKNSSLAAPAETHENSTSGTALVVAPANISSSNDLDTEGAQSLSARQDVANQEISRREDAAQASAFASQPYSAEPYNAFSGPMMMSLMPNVVKSSQQLAPGKSGPRRPERPDCGCSAGGCGCR